jgi:SAM-dependent methyltransferase
MGAEEPRAPGDEDRLGHGSGGYTDDLQDPSDRCDASAKTDRRWAVGSIARPMTVPERATASSRAGAETGSAVRLVVLSSLMLFVELGLIRWSGSYVVYLAFFTNFVLLASFLGVGVGFLRVRSSRDLFAWAPAALTAFLLFIALFPVEGARVAGELRFVGGFGLPALPKWLSLGAIFLLAFLVMAAIAEGVGRTFVRFPPLEAYRWDILGSIAGIVGFSVLSFLHAPPFVWGAVATVLLVWLLGRPGVAQLVALAASLAILALLSFAPRTSWSPYYRITTTRPDADGSVGIDVNGRPHQRIMPLATMEANQTFRFEPYEHVPGNPLTDVLIVGAGSGNDVAIALSRGAAHVDAVEIDPLLYGLGRDDHPNRPYQDPRVTVHVEDARSFLHDTDARYDLVLYAIPDSLTVLAGQSSLRLESYLLTVEAMREVEAHLKPHGAISMYHYYLPMVVDRYASALDRVFGHPPCLELTPGAGPRPRTVLTATVQPADLDCPQLWREPTALIDPVTDDHPFAYLVGSGIPAFYQVTLLLIVLASAAAVRAAAGPFGAMRPYLDLFAMGAAFLLLETSNVVRFALLFGTTWLVNALVFAGILVSVYLAIEVSRSVRFRQRSTLYAALFAALVVAWAVPPESLLGLDAVPRFLAAVALGFAPVFVANLIFADRFRDVGSSAVAFGTNLLGAIVGGVLEYAALVTGYRALLIVVAALYLGALMAGRSKMAAIDAAG